MAIGVADGGARGAGSLIHSANPRARRGAAAAIYQVALDRAGRLRSLGKGQRRQH